MTVQLTPKELKAYKRVSASSKLFSRSCCKVLAKDTSLVPFHWNRAQRRLNEKLDAQLKDKGRVRALVLKGRQQGVSTFVGARFYWKASTKKGVKVYILAHEQPASDNLFEIVERFHENNPFKPNTGTANAKELEFDELGSKYKVATAGQKAGGRSSTTTLYHGSEVAFWKNDKDHFAASVQAVPEEPGTEIILETTANGPVGQFYERWQDAIRGVGDYIAIFIPWFWQEEYSREPEAGFALSDSAEAGEMSETDYAEMFDCSLAQMCWRRAKIHELGGLPFFNQEYPATAEMAFSNSGGNAFISSQPVLDARKRTVEGGGPLIMGADPAGPGGDRFAICGRRGHNVEYLKWRNKLETSEAFHWCKSVILKHEPARFNVDAGGIGAAILSLLKEDEDIPDGVVRGVNFGATSQYKTVNPKKAGPKNRRAEMWNRMREWLTNADEPVSIPDEEALQADITAPRLKATATNDILLESKEVMRAQGVRSPDLADALALTFASATVIRNYVEKKPHANQYGNPDTQPTKSKAKNEPVTMSKMGRQSEYMISGSSNGWMS